MLPHLFLHFAEEEAQRFHDWLFTRPGTPEIELIRQR